MIISISHFPPPFLPSSPPYSSPPSPPYSPSLPLPLPTPPLLPLPLPTPPLPPLPLPTPPLPPPSPPYSSPPSPFPSLLLPSLPLPLPTPPLPPPSPHRWSHYLKIHLSQTSTGSPPVPPLINSQLALSFLSFPALMVNSCWSLMWGVWKRQWKDTREQSWELAGAEMALPF